MAHTVRDSVHDLRSARTSSNWTMAVVSVLSTGTSLTELGVSRGIQFLEIPKPGSVQLADTYSSEIYYSSFQPI